MEKNRVEVIGLRVCSWCKEFLGFLKVKVSEEMAGRETPISHGICPECKDRVLEEMNGESA